jgi:mannosyltransferase OCH1-like enzyme
MNNFILRRRKLQEIFLKRQRLQIFLKRQIVKNIFNNIKELINNKNNQEVIPRNIFQAWHSDNLPNSVKSCIENIKSCNPNFHHYLYNDEKCREFIKHNFSEDVLKTYDAIIPAAIKIDLWRYCVLYKYGGIYLDVKYFCVNGFNFNYLLDREYFCKDFDKYGIYNAIIICKPNNEIMKKCINEVVKNVNNNFYGNTLTEPTGPLMIKKYISDIHVNRLLLNVTNGIPNPRNKENTNIKFKNFVILHFHDNYRNEQPKFNKYWADCWTDRTFYDVHKLTSNINFSNLFNTEYNTNIPKVIYMCHKKLDKIKIYSQKWKELNPEYEIKLYDDNLCQQFLLEEYSQLHLDIFNFIPDGPIKCDFWRLCIINKYGGLYVDADINPLVPLKQYIEEDDDFVTCISLFYTIGETEWQLNPHLILSHKNNEILEKNIENFIDLYKNNKEKYNYWDWSICKRLYINGVREKKSHVLIENGKKYKFLYEKTLNDCEYNDIIVLHNHYDNYTNNRFY